MTDFRAKLTEYIRREAMPAHKFGHQPRVYRLTLLIAQGASAPITYDDDVVFAAIYLHDLGVFLGHRPSVEAELVRWDSAKYASERAPELLREVGFPERKIAAVVDCIREHQPKDVPRSIEATLIRDADLLEQLGAIAVLRTAAKVGSDTRFVYFADAVKSLRHALQSLPDLLRLDASRKLAVSRVAFLRAFLDELDAETGEYLG